MNQNTPPSKVEALREELKGCDIGSHECSEYSNCKIEEFYVDGKKYFRCATKEKEYTNILQAFATFLQGLELPEKRKLPDISESWPEPWMHRAGGVTDFNQAINETQAALHQVVTALRGGTE